MGRVLTDQRTTNSVTRSATYSYLPNLDGSINSVTYPTGRTVTYSYDTAARPLSAVDQANGVNYATSASYAPQGALAAMTMGWVNGGFGGVSVTTSFNDRLQPVEIRASSSAGTALDLTYNFNLGAGDNGNVVGITNNLDSTRSQSFTYDSLNRIATAGTQSTSGSNCWGEQYSYDAWGNLLSVAPPSSYNGCTVESFSISVTANNQISGLSYDASGNLTYDGVNNYAWNALSEIKTAAGVNYTYDGDGQRVEKSSGTLYWDGPGGEVLDETDLSGNLTSEYVYFDGRRVARRDASGNVYYYTGDFLGSARAMVTSSGAKCYDADFYPFGGERSVTDTCPQNYKFTGKERDTETGNDYFGARYYASNFGRFLSPDWSAIPAPVPYANLTNPQTLNLYAIVRDNPETFADLDGHTGQCTIAGACNQTAPPSHTPPPGEDGQAQQQKSGDSQPVPPPAQQQNTETAQNSTSQHGLTVGVGVSGNADAGVVGTGAEANGTAVVTASVSSKLHLSVGAAASGGAVAYAGKHVKAKPNQEVPPLVMGGYAGGGVTVMVANTASSNQLRGPFETIQGNIGLNVSLSGSLSFDSHGDVVLQFTIGPGWGISGFAITTNTKAACAGAGCN